jgi:hypothetical protein
MHEIIVTRNEHGVRMTVDEFSLTVLHTDGTFCVITNDTQAHYFTSPDDTEAFVDGWIDLALGSIPDNDTIMYAENIKE